MKHGHRHPRSRHFAESLRRGTAGKGRRSQPQRNLGRGITAVQNHEGVKIVEHGVFVRLVSERLEGAEAVSVRTRELADELFWFGGALETHLHQCRPCSYEKMESLATAQLDQHFVRPVLGLEPPSW